MTKGIFITGTDTGVGKTFITAGLIRAMRTRGIAVCPMKPVETGCRKRNDRLIPGDAVKLIRASGVREPLDVINPYRMRHALAPSVASAIEGTGISKVKIVAAYKKLSRKYDIILVEGAGGIMVPLHKKYLFLDLAEELAIPVLVVARAGLGTINHTLLTLEAIRGRGLDVLGVIVNCSVRSGGDLSENTNPGVIEKLGRVRILGTVPYSVNTRNPEFNGRLTEAVEIIIAEIS